MGKTPAYEGGRYRSVDPAVGAGWGLVFVLVDVHVEFFAVALEFPVGDFVAEPEEVGIAAEVEVADEHASEVADMADFVVAEAKGTEKSDGDHSGDDPFHFYGDGYGDDVGLTIRKENAAGDEDAEDGAGSANGGDVGIFVPPKHGKGFNDDVDNASADAG